MLGCLFEIETLEYTKHTNLKYEHGRSTRISVPSRRAAPAGGVSSCAPPAPFARAATAMYNALPTHGDDEDSGQLQLASEEPGFQGVRLEQILNLKGWDS